MKIPLIFLALCCFFQGETTTKSVHSLQELYALPAGSHLTNYETNGIIHRNIPLLQHAVSAGTSREAHSSRKYDLHL
ncbi:hypothetical protein HMPREF9999_00008 [Alloprevotella sp. oral taxon 473 str. F0040]|nr:hypothetical protein HMPREF9999_00008 [Alloprevotella sp. oral taxon 473 str. F0040]